MVCIFSKPLSLFLIVSRFIPFLCLFSFCCFQPVWYDWTVQIHASRSNPKSMGMVRILGLCVLGYPMPVVPTPEQINILSCRFLYHKGVWLLRLEFQTFLSSVSTYWYQWNTTFLIFVSVGKTLPASKAVFRGIKTPFPQPAIRNSITEYLPRY